MSCSFWNMRRRLKAQQKEKDKIIADIATAQAKEKKVVAETATTPKPRKKPAEKAVQKDNDNTAD